MLRGEEIVVAPTNHHFLNGIGGVNLPIRDEGPIFDPAGMADHILGLTKACSVPTDEGKSNTAKY